jgi:hypothetical protein
MEFPGLPSDWSVTLASSFENAGAHIRDNCKGVDLIAQLRQSGRIQDNFKVRVSGAERLRVVMDPRVFGTVTFGERFTFCMELWCRDIEFKANSVSSEWTDVVDLLQRREMNVFAPNSQMVSAADFLTELELDEEAGNACLRWAITVADDNKLQLVLQMLPESAEVVNGKPVLKR